MIVDFQHHFTPRELMPKDLGRPADPALRRAGRAELHHALAALRPRRARPHDGRGRHRRRLAHQRGRACAPILRPRASSTTRPRRRSAIIPAASSAPRMPIRSAAPMRFRSSRAASTNSAFQGVVITSETDGLLSRCARVRAVLERVREARHVRVRAPRAQAQPSRSSSTATTPRARSAASSR